MGISSALAGAVNAVPVGSVTAFAGSSAPSGWLLCGGQNVLRAQFPSLFLTIGTTYGSGDGSTTFALPDLRGRVPAGLDNMGGTAASRLTSTYAGFNGSTLGATGGNERLQAHAHNYDRTTLTAPNYVNFGGASNIYAATPAATATTTAGSGSSENVQPTIILNYIIKAS
jgi:microcystin-dependent protein